VDLGNAGIAAVVGAIAARVAMGNFVDVYGPRFGISICIGLTAPAVYCIGMSTSAIGFILSRLFIGFSLATFVACQFWCTRWGPPPAAAPRRPAPCRQARHLACF
jgi:NNP family nitrate/nitrite transporter-like MFS transporter